MDITINSGLKSLIRPLTETEYSGLEAAILRDSIREPLAVWDNGGKFILLDGHNRKKICDKHGIEYKTRVIKKVTLGGEELDLDSLDRAQIWVAHNQGARRNLESADWALLVAEIMPAFSADAKRRLEEGQKNKPTYGGDNKGVTLGNSLPSVKPVKSATYDEDKAVVQAIESIAPSQTNKTYVQAALKEGGYKDGEFTKPEKFKKLKEDVGAAPKKAKHKIMPALIKAAKDKVKVAAAKKSAEAAPGTATIYAEDCMGFLKRFEKKSVDLLLTDPLYMTDVADIAKFAKEWLPVALSKLKDTGRGFVFIGAYPEELRAYLNTALPEQLLVWTYNNTIGPMPKKKHFQNWQAVLYYQGEKAADWNESQIKNVFSSQTHNAPDGRLGPKYYTWEKPMELVKQIIARSTNKGDVIIDPFAGSGTHLIAGKLLGRKAFGCDYDKKVVKIAVDRGCAEE